MRHHIIIPLLLIMALFSCQSTPDHPEQVDSLPQIFPDYIDVTIPAGIAPLNFAMLDDQVKVIDVVVRGAKGEMLHSQGTCTDFDINDWHLLTEANQGDNLTVTVCTKEDGRWKQYRDFSIHVSRHPLDEWGITYRRIAPGYEIYSKMGIFERELSTFQETPLLLNTQSQGMCINCHTPNRTHPDQHVFHVRGEHGATLVHRDGKYELLQARNDSIGGSMVYPYWHPSGRYCAFSTNRTSQMFHTHNAKRIEVYDSSSDVFVYDTERHTMLRDTLTMRKYWAENTPVFSPDGQWLYFITARRQVYPTDYDKERYSLCRVRFDEQTGRMSATVDTLIQADTLGKSVTWPRPSYDGRYIMYTQANYGYFSVWHPESDLWMLDLQSLETYPLTGVNSNRAESFHNWSTGSRWFLFTSRRDDNLYTRIYLSCIDDNGKATKPFLLPQRNPKRYYQHLMYSYNTPDFTSAPVGLDAREMGNQIDSDHRVVTKVAHLNGQE